MRHKFLIFCTAGLITANLCIPAAGVSLANVRPNLIASINPAVQEPIYNVPDAEGTISLPNLESRMRNHNLNILSLQSTLDAQEAFDRKKAYDNLVDQINGLTDYIWFLSTSGTDTSLLEMNIESMMDQLESLKEENYEETMEMLSLQIENSIQQIIKGSESLYLSILSYESKLTDLNRTLNTLDRNMKEMELRHQLGQVSQLTLQQLNATYHSTKSQATSLELSIEKMKASLQSLLGETPNGDIILTGLPDISKNQKKLLNIKYENTLQAAKEKSFTLYQAKKTLEDAEEVWEDITYSTNSSKYKTAEQTYQSAVYTYESTVKDFELSFQNLYQAVPDAQQALEAAKSAFEYQEQNYASAQLKHQLGKISDSALETAKAEMLNAASSVAIAEINAYTAVHSYQWAAEYGIVG